MTRQDDGSDGFLSRWSRLKRTGGEEGAEAAEVPPGVPETLSDRPDVEILEELGLPDPETLGPGDDFSAFMAKAVPERIRQLALRRLWGSNPVLANLDGLVDYGEDFTDAALVVADLATAYRVGKGMPQPEPVAPEAVTPEETEAEAEAASEELAGGDPGTSDEAADDPALAAKDAVAAPAADPPAAVDPGPTPPSDDLAAARPRRMRFTVAPVPTPPETA